MLLFGASAAFLEQRECRRNKGMVANSWWIRCPKMEDGMPLATKPGMGSKQLTIRIRQFTDSNSLCSKVIKVFYLHTYVSVNHTNILLTGTYQHHELRIYNLSKIGWSCSILPSSYQIGKCQWVLQTVAGRHLELII